MARAFIAGTGAYLPAEVLTNFDLEKMVETSDEWITKNTGIRERRIIAPGETTVSMALEASRAGAMRRGQLDVSESSLEESLRIKRELRLDTMLGLQMVLMPQFADQVLPLASLV